MNIIFSYFRTLYHGRDCAKLIFIDDAGIGNEFVSYRNYLEDLIDVGMSTNSVRKYSRAVSQFLDYLYIGFEVLGSVNEINATFLCDSYYSYLVCGSRSDNSVVRSISEIRPNRRVKIKTAIGYHVPITQFVGLSDNYANQLDAPFVSQFSMGDEISILRALCGISRKILILNGADLRAHFKKNNFGKKRQIYKWLPNRDPIPDIVDDTKCFPLDKISSLIAGASCYRDAALWSLIAASGLRASEALQVLFDDVDIDERKVYAIDPLTRESVAYSYSGISEGDFNRLSWKGRRTRYTLLIEPYGGLFFKYLELYWKYECDLGALHNFIFQTRDGTPLRFSSYKDQIIIPFKKAAAKVLGDNVDIKYRFKLHSLRHSYCVFLKNFIVHSEGVGLSDEEIMLIVGQATLKSVQIYSIVDREILEAKLAGAFFNVDNVSGVSYNEHMLKYHTGRVDSLLKLIRAENAELMSNAA